MKLLFVTGAPRTGTTLVDKLLTMHPQIDVLSQPLPLLYVELKAAFLAAHRRPEAPYPVNDMFLSNYYDPRELVSFLDRYQIDAAFSARVLRAMIPYPGQYTKPEQPLFFQHDYRACTLSEYVLGYCRALSSKRAASAVGAKESFCEEFIPYFLARNQTAIQLVRDPRDAIASLLYGAARRHGGLGRPLLFYVRQWRKSALFALAHRGCRGYWLLRYEDVTTRPYQALNPVAETLTGARYDADAFAGDLRTANGDVWQSNSSHAPTPRLSASSIGTHRTRLPDGLRRFIEASCHSEMIALGYPPGLDPRECRETLERHADDSSLERPQLAGYQWSEARAREELARIDAIEEDRFVANLFIFPEAFRALRAAHAGST